MKLAWIIYDEYGTAEIVFKEPERYSSGRVVQIVYAVIEEQT
jgi:hypothetical protein